MNQFALPLDWPPADPESAFIVTDSNRVAVQRCHAPGTWPVATMILSGPRKSGRSLFGRIFAQRTGGTVIDDADRHDERAVFTAWNDAQGARRPLLLIADAPPPFWQATLPDLRSRLAATPTVAFESPDDGLTSALILALLARRGVAIDPDVVAYLLPRVERSHHSVIELVDALDQAALSRQGPVTIPLARTVFARITMGDLQVAG